MRSASAGVLVASILLLVSTSLEAQGIRPAAGRGRPAPPLGGPAGIGDEMQARQGGRPDVAKQIEEMGSLGDAVHKVPDLSASQKDSIKAIERRYHELFKGYAKTLRAAGDSARAMGAAPDFQTMATMRMQADSVRDAELAAARGVLSSDQQRQKFDANVAEMKEKEAKREEEMRRRRMMGGAGMGGMRP